MRVAQFSGGNCAVRTSNLVWRYDHDGEISRVEMDERIEAGSIGRVHEDPFRLASFPFRSAVKRRAKVTDPALAAHLFARSLFLSVYLTAFSRLRCRRRRRSKLEKCPV